MEPIASPTRPDLLQKINEKKYRVNSDYLLREIAGEYAIIPAAFLWNAFQQPRTISEVVAQALEEYEAAEDTIQNSALNFVHDTLRYALLEEVISL